MFESVTRIEIAVCKMAFSPLGVNKHVTREFLPEIVEDAISEHSE
jgi:hypothetical protein